VIVRHAALRVLLLAAAVFAAGCGRGGDGARLVAVEKLSGGVGFYDLQGRRAAEAQAGRHPHEMAFSPDRRFLYVTDNGIVWMTDPGDGDNTISIIDVAERRRVGTIDLGANRRPHGIDVDPATGRIVVTTENPSGLLLIDPAARKVLRRYDTHGLAPHIVLLGSGAKTAWASNDRTGDVAAVDLDTGAVTTIPIGPRPQGEAFSADRGTLYVASMGGNVIAVIDAATSRKTGEIPTGQGPCRVAVSPDGKTLVYALQQGRAVGFADLGTMREIGQTALSGPPVSLTLSGDGTAAYSSVQERDQVFVISLATRQIAQVMQFPKGAGPDPVLPLPSAR
jgi:YVTN family beta-propeller protein